MILLVCDDLAALAEGLLLLTGGAIAGFVGAPAGDGRPGLAMSRARQLADIMGTKFMSCSATVGS